MKTKMLRWIAPAVLSLALVACSDDDAPSDPAGTVTLNMLDAENGKTYLGSTGFYINEADNFYSNGPFWIADVGPVRGIGSLGGPATSGLTDEAAVMPGHGYMIFADDALLVFPSGTTATVVGSEYCKVYVDSWLAEDKGAVVKYLSDRVSADGLPGYDDPVGIIDWSTESLEIELASSDFEAVCEPGRGVRSGGFGPRAEDQARDDVRRFRRLRYLCTHRRPLHPYSCRGAVVIRCRAVLVIYGTAPGFRVVRRRRSRSCASEVVDVQVAEVERLGDPCAEQVAFLP